MTERRYISVSSKPGKFGSTLYGAVFDHLGINATYVPLSLDLPNGGNINFNTFFDLSVDSGVCGISVSMPYKGLAYYSLSNLERQKPYYVSNISSDVEKVENLNTIKIDRDMPKYGLISIELHNTDILGIKDCLINFSNIKTATIVGNGCVSRSVIEALDCAGISYNVYARTGTNIYPVTQLKNAKPSDLLINATPIGMTGIHDDLFTEDVIERHLNVFDVVVNRETNLIKNAKKLQKTWCNGVELSFHQFMHQFNVYFGFYPPMNILEKELEKNGYI